MSVNGWLDEMVKLPLAGKSHWGGWYFVGREDATGSVTPKEGQLLYDAVRTVKPQVVLEIGTSHGYSGIHIAQALKDNGFGHLHTVEIDDMRREYSGNNFQAAGLTAWVTQYAEPPELEKVDLAFLDAGHTTAEVRQYLTFCHECPIVYVHDVLHNDHVTEAVKFFGSMEVMDTDSSCKMAVVYAR